MTNHIDDTINKALDLGRLCNLNNQQMQYLIKAIAQDRFGTEANQHLKKFNIKITEEDACGIERANKFLGDKFQEFLDLLEQ